MTIEDRFHWHGMMCAFTYVTGCDVPTIRDVGFEITDEKIEIGERALEINVNKKEA
jgi:hypothetical protein